MAKKVFTSGGFVASDNDAEEDGTARAERLWAERTATRPGHFAVSLHPFGHLGLLLDQITASIAADRERHLEQRRGRALTAVEQLEIASDIGRQVLAGRRRIEALAVAHAKDVFENRPLNRHRVARILRLSAQLLTIGGGRPTTVLAELVYINFHQAREQLAPVARKLRAVRNADTAWRWLQQSDAALAAEIVERGFKDRWFVARSRPTLDRMAAELISDHHPGVSLNTLVRYGRRKPLK